MHQQLGGSPNQTSANMRAILAALANVNLKGIAPSFDPPHVRVLVEDDDFDTAYEAMKAAGLEPTVHSAVTMTIPDDKNMVNKAWDGLEAKGYVVESVLVVPGGGQGQAIVSFGVTLDSIPNWSDAAAEEVANDILANL